MERSDQIGDLMAALAKAQAEFTFAAKNSDNPAFRSTYADLASYISATRPVLAKHGIALMQFNTSDPTAQTASVRTSLHLGEQWIAETAEAPAVGMKGFNVQSIGACWTYLRRYTLAAICGLASDDDDGNSLAVDSKPVSIKSQVFAEVERQKKDPAHPGGVFEYRAPKLTCVPFDVEKRTTKGALPRDYIYLKLNGECEGKAYATCWHANSFAVLLSATGKPCEFNVSLGKDAKYLTIDKVLSVDGEITSDHIETYKYSETGIPF